MPNTKSIGVAFADPELDSVTVSGPVVANGGVIASTIQTTGNEVAANLNAEIGRAHV